MKTLLLLAAAVLSFPVQGPQQAAPHSALVPAERLAEPWWKERLEACNRRLAQGGVDLVFIGDSITQGWEGEGKPVWDELYGARKAVNLGFSGDRTQHVLWRLEKHGLEALAATPPKLVVLMIGTNNSNGSDNSAEEIADGIEAIVAKLRARLPATKVLLLAIFPRGERDDAQRAKVAAASQRASRVADGKHVHYLDLAPVFLEPDKKTLLPAVMPDHLHLSAEGYRRWGTAIEPKVRELLGEGAAPAVVK